MGGCWVSGCPEPALSSDTAGLQGADYVWEKIHLLLELVVKPRWGSPGMWGTMLGMPRPVPNAPQLPRAQLCAAQHLLGLVLVNEMGPPSHPVPNWASGAGQRGFILTHGWECGPQGWQKHNHGFLWPQAAPRSSLQAGRGGSNVPAYAPRIQRRGTRLQAKQATAAIPAGCFRS